MKLLTILAPGLLCAPAFAQGIALFDVVQGPGSTTYFGETFADIGDCDGDGVADIAVGMRRGNAVRVISGSDRSLVFERAQVIPNPPGFGGISVGPAGDFDGDGRGDLVVLAGTSGNFQSASRALVLSGLDGSTLLSIAPPANGFTFPSSAARPLDVDGDGVMDLVVSAFRAGGEDRGSVFAFSGATGGLLWRVDGERRERMGFPVILVDDIDADGVRDIAVGSRNGVVLDFNNPGQVRLLSGASGAMLARREGPVQYAQFGFILASVADRNGDGVRDIAARQVLPAAEKGVVFLSGTDLSTVGRIAAAASNFNPATSLDGGGDFDGDGIEDLLVGSTRLAEVYSGVDDSLMGAVTDPSQFFGGHVRFLGDQDSDGLPEMGVGRFFQDPGELVIYESTPRNGGVICVGRPNGATDRGRLDALSPSGFEVAAADLTLRASGLPPETFGLLVVGDGRNRIFGFGGSRGTTCIAGGGIGRLVDDVVQAGAGGQASIAPDLTALPWTDTSGFSFRSVAAGETYGFQLWYRDVQGPSGSTSNFSDAVTVTFR